MAPPGHHPVQPHGPASMVPLPSQALLYEATEDDRLLQSMGQVPVWRPAPLPQTHPAHGPAFLQSERTEPFVGHPPQWPAAGGPLSHVPTMCGSPPSHPWMGGQSAPSPTWLTPPELPIPCFAPQELPNPNQGQGGPTIGMWFAQQQLESHAYHPPPHSMPTAGPMMGMQQMVQHQRGMDFAHDAAPAMTAPGPMMGMQQMVQHQRGMDFVHNVAPAMTAPGPMMGTQQMVQHQRGMDFTHNVAPAASGPSHGGSVPLMTPRRDPASLPREPLTSQGPAGGPGGVRDPNDAGRQLHDTAPAAFPALHRNVGNQMTCPGPGQSSDQGAGTMDSCLPLHMLNSAIRKLPWDALAATTGLSRPMRVASPDGSPTPQSHDPATSVNHSPMQQAPQQMPPAAREMPGLDPMAAARDSVGGAPVHSRCSVGPLLWTPVPIEPPNAGQ
ncbi:unnamed protein product [Symbiodinium natans]|uniref:Uncharacterized protein n=1 Tax=Symbiodinium natans TaxID=878477 RepID=A0A812HMY2_9DINO|nr:unnamed protein product [Symbiodinium natans]